MHQALYRKWRPQVFDDVCGQDHITSILKYEVANGKTNHAYLFCGSRGTGKTTCAKILAKAVNCEAPVDGNPCGVCDSCRQIDAGATTDVLEMDAASNTGVEYIRDIRDEVIYSPSLNRFRVYIIDEVHMLSISAFNALLKTLEEPPQNVIFILATTELQKIPATVLSRWQRFDFRRIPSQVIADRLLYVAGEEGIDLEEEAAFLIAKLAQGGMRDALSMLELCSGEEGSRRITPTLVEEVVGVIGRAGVSETVAAILDKDYEKLFAVVDRLYLSSLDVSVFFGDLLSFYRDMLVSKSIARYASYLDLTENEREEIKRFADRFTIERLLEHTKRIEDTLQALQRSASQKRVIAELSLVRLCDEKLNTSPDALLSRIAALEEKLAQGVRYVQPAAESVSEEKTPEPEAETAVSEKQEAALTELLQCEEPPSPQAPAPSPETRFDEWRDVVKSFEKNDPGTAPFLSRMTAWEKDGGLLICSPDQFALTMTDHKHIREQLAMIIASLTDRPIPWEKITFICEDRKEPESGSFLDELN